MNSGPISPSLSLVIPLYDEGENVEPLLERVHRGLAPFPGAWELICIDDGSRDDTWKALQALAPRYGPHVRIVRLGRNFGQTAAMQAGFDLARGELIATLDGDLQNDPGEIPRLVQELLDRDLDLLQGWRKHRQDRLLRTIPSWFANRLIARVTGVRLHDYGCSLKIYRASVIKHIHLFGEMHRFIPVWIASVTDPQRIGETVVRHEARRFGTSKYGLSRTFRVLLDLLSAFFFLRYQARPGHFFGAFGLVFGTLGTLIMGYLSIIKFGAGEDIGGRPLLFIGILFLVASIQLLTTGVLAELLIRTAFQASSQTPFRIAWQSDPEGVRWKTPE